MSDEVLQERLESHCRGEFGAPKLSITSLARVPEGHSGFTYFVDFENGPHSRLVLRVPPPGAQPRGPADVCRQGRIMSALYARGLPVPKIVASSDNPANLDGRPFILMEAVDGLRAERAVAHADNIELARSAVEAMRDVHAVPAKEAGIGDEPVRTLEEEIERWRALMVRAPEELTSRAADLCRKLAGTMPAGGRHIGLVHGDFTYGNLLFSGSKVSAILDWEIAQLGDCLMDLGSLCVIAKRHDFPKDPNPSGAVRASVEWLIDEYGTSSGSVEWYIALSYYKYAAIVGYNTMLHRRGKRPDPIYDLMPETVVGLIDGALEILK